MKIRKGKDGKLYGDGGVIINSDGIELIKPKRKKVYRDGTVEFEGEKIVEINLDNVDVEVNGDE